MRKLFITAVVLTISAMAFAQSTNPLNYSGKLYVSSIDVLTTPRYISYEEHAILSKELTVPTVEVTPIIMDFEKGIIHMDGKENKVNITACKRYTKDCWWEVVIYMEMIEGGDRMELVWKECGSPFLQQISTTEDGVKIARINLSLNPKVTSPEEALLQMLGVF